MKIESASTPEGVDGGSGSIPPPGRPTETELWTCDQVIEMFGAYLAHDLSFKRHARFVEHIRSCGSCHEKLFTLELVIHMAGHEAESQTTVTGSDDGTNNT